MTTWEDELTKSNYGKEPLWLDTSNTALNVWKKFDPILNEWVPATPTIFDMIEGGQLKLGSAKGNGNLKVYVDKNQDGILEIVGSIDDDGAYFPAIYADNISGNMENTYVNSQKVFYFDSVNGSDTGLGLSWGTAINNIQSFINALPKNLNGATLTLWVRNQILGGIKLNGFHNGDIIITAENSASIINVFGQTQIYRCGRGKFMLQYLSFQGDGSTGSGPLVDVEFSDFVSIYGCKVYGNNKAAHAFFFDSSRFMVDSVEGYGVTDRGIYALRNSIGFVANCLGSVPVAILADTGSIVNGVGTRWAGSLVSANNGSIGAPNGTAWKQDVWTINSGTTAPSAPTQSTEQTLSVAASTGDNYSSQGFWTNDEVKQGDYGYGNRYGIWYFGNLRSTLAGKKIVSAQLTLYRNSGGASAGRTVYIRTHGYAARVNRPSGKPALSSAYNGGSIAVGQTKTFDITGLVQANIANGMDVGLGIMTPSGGSTDYMSVGITPSLVVRYK